MAKNKITALKLQKKNHQRVNVYINDEYAFGLARIVAAWLEVGQEIDDEKIAQLKEEDAIEVAYQKALRYLHYRPRSEAEIRKHLIDNGISDIQTELVVKRLKEIGLLNDIQFASSWVENRIEFHPRGHYALAYELRNHGIENQIIEKVLENIDEDALAYKAASKYARRFRTLDRKNFQKKMLGYLQRRGFNYTTSVQAVEKVWQDINLDKQNMNEEALL